MRIAALTRLSALMLLAAVLGVAVSVGWGLEKLKEPFALNTAYFETVEQVSVQTRSLINRYLNSGDAAALTAAQDFLQTDLAVSLSQLPDALQAGIQPSVDALAKSLEVDLRAAGKLGANPQALLIQNEREMYAALDSLRDYIVAAEGLADLQKIKDFRRINNELFNEVAERSLVRGDYFATYKEALIASLNSRSERIEILATELSKLPLLGVLAEAEVDEFAALMGLDEGDAGTAEAADKGEDLVNNIHSLASRYNAELTNTLDLVARAHGAKGKVDSLVKQLEEKALESKIYIDELRDQVQQQVILGVALGLLVLMLVGIASVLLQFAVLRGIGRVSNYIQSLSSGDFSQSLNWQTRFVELNSLTERANQMQGYLKQLVEEIRTEVNVVQEVSRSMDELAVSTEQSSQLQSQLTDQVSMAMSELLTSFQEVANHAVSASDAASNGEQSVQQSAEVMQALEAGIGELAQEVRQGVEMISRLQEDSQNIQSVLNVIVSIADQTNLLALNAAIEAARAGEHGRGFAVVADEVRQLAQRTSESTKEIHGIIEGLQSSSNSVAEAMLKQQQKAEQSVEHSKTAGEMLNHVVASISEINNANTMIASATEEQVYSAKGVQEGLQEVQHSVHEAAKRTAASRQQSEELSEVSRGLDQLVARYQV